MDNETKAAAKTRGFLPQRDKEHFAYRVRIPGGVAAPEQLEALGRIAKRCGDGRLCMTSRFCIELTGIPHDQLDEAEALVHKAGLFAGAMGAKVRPIVCCKATYCQFGQIDAFALVERLDARFYERPAPHKFKINITGCPNNCAKVQLNDIGIMPQKGGYKVFVGGRAGRKLQLGEALSAVVPDDKLEDILEAVLAFYDREAMPKERLATLIERKKAEDTSFTVERILL